MNDLRTAAQQALEVLEDWESPVALPAIVALRAALAEPRPIHECYGDCPTNPQTCPNPCNFEGRPRPVQEPVANRAFLERILTAMEGVIDVADRKTDEFDALRSCVIDLTLMLHTAPPQRKPLVDPAEYDDAGAAERYNRGLK